MEASRVPPSLATPVAVGSALLTLTRYRAAILPAVDRELWRWTARAATIPDPVLRDAAVRSVTEKRGNVEAVATLMTLAPRRGRAAVVRASTALQVAIDYLDTLGEEAGPEELADGLQLHRSLGTALTPGAAPLDWYAHHPRGEDGGYLDALVAACQEAVAALPSPVALPAARRAAERCGEGQSHTHAEGGTGLEAWAVGLEPEADLRWWEAAAGASSSVGAHALIALAGTPAATAEEVARIEEAYDPWIGSLTVLLDDLVDRDADADDGQHNFVRLFADEAPARIDFLVAGARRALRAAPRRLAHEAILDGVLAYYLGDPALPDPRPASADAPSVRALAAAIKLAN